MIITINDMLLGYKDQFVQKLQSGVKIHTLRAKRKLQIEPGDKLQHYGKVRQRGMFKIMPDNHCVSNQEVQIWDYSDDVRVHVDGKQLSKLDQAEFCINDGFDSWDDFKAFWLNHPKRNEIRDEDDAIIFSGVCHHWTDKRY